MRSGKKFLACVTAALLLMMVTAFAEQGTVDWNKGIIRATGIGAGKPNFQKKNPGIYRAQAKRAAIMDAQRNLAESVKGVRVTSDSTMEDMILQSDVVRTRVDSIIKGMSEVSSQYYEDGTYEVVLEMPLFGANDSLAEAAFLPFKDEPKVAFPQPTNPINSVPLTGLPAPTAPTNPTIPTNPTAPTMSGNNYTGLIIDCHGMNINHVMSPVILNANGQKIYGHQNLDFDKIIREGMASYASDAYDQISRARAGNNPLIVKAVELVDHNANPVVSVADADKILVANQHDRFLDNCAVVFIK